MKKVDYVEEALEIALRRWLPIPQRTLLRRCLRKLVRDTVRHAASEMYYDEREYLLGEVDRIAKRLVP